MYPDRTEPMRTALATATLLVALTVATAVPSTAAAPIPSQPLAPHLLAFSPTPYPEVTPVADYYAEKARKEAERAERKRLSRLRESRVANETTRRAQTTKKPSTGALTEAQVRSLIESGCDRYGITGKDRAWVIEAWMRVTWSESRWNPSAQNPNSTACGIAQFLAAWGDKEKRLDPLWSAHRFARVYAEGGKAKIRQHWKATIGGL